MYVILELDLGAQTVLGILEKQHDFILHNLFHLVRNNTLVSHSESVAIVKLALLIIFLFFPHSSIVPDKSHFALISIVSPS